MLKIAAKAAGGAEGTGAGATHVCTVTRSGSSVGPAFARWAVTGEAMAGTMAATADDFVGGVLPGGLVVFADGQTQQNISFTTAGDLASEPNESYAVTLVDAPGGVNIAAARAAGAIPDDDTTSASLSISAGAPSHPEGNSGATVFSFTVVRNGPPAGPASVDWAVTGSTGVGFTAATAADFVANALPSGSLALADGEAGKTFTVEVAGDTALEGDQGVTVTLSNASAGIALATAAATSVFTNDDGTTLAIAALDASNLEGHAGTTAFTFLVTRRGDTTGVSGAAWSVAGSGPRPAGAMDFGGGILPAGFVVFQPGETVQTVTVDVAGDTLVEGHETFTVTLADAPVDVTFAGNTAIGTIGADDAVVDLAVVDSTTGLAVADLPRFYAGPVAAVEKEFILLTPANLNISVNGDNWFIHSGSGTDGLTAHGGRNVLDGGTGSNFLTGAAGEDTFFLDTRGATTDIWSTVVGFGQGDSATVWGVTQEGFTIQWLNDLGTPGFTALTMFATSPGKPNALLTLAGFSNADLTSRKLEVTFGSIDLASPYLFISRLT